MLLLEMIPMQLIREPPICRGSTATVLIVAEPAGALESVETLHQRSTFLQEYAQSRTVAQSPELLVFPCLCLLGAISWEAMLRQVPVHNSHPKQRSLRACRSVPHLVHRAVSAPTLRGSLHQVVVISALLSQRAGEAHRSTLSSRILRMPGSAHCELIRKKRRFTTIPMLTQMERFLLK